MMVKLKHLLAFLQDNLDADRQMKADALHRRVLNWETVERLPIIMSYPFPEESPFQPLPHREIFDSPEKMLYNELVAAWGTSICLRPEIGDDLPCTIRANFGTNIMAAFFGGKVEQIEDNPPWVRHFKTEEEFKKILDVDPDDFSQGICPQIIQFYQVYHQILEDYPDLKKMIHITMPDLQGPLDTVGSLRGSDIFVDFYINPGLVHQTMEHITLAQIGFAKKIKALVTDGPFGYSHQHGFLVRGNILLRDDSSVMISPDIYREYVAPYDEKILLALDGGGVHCCGKIEHNMDAFFALPSIQCFDFGQSHMNGVGAIYEMARAKKIPLLRIQPTGTELISGEIMKRFPTGVSLFYEAASFDEARELMKRYAH